MTTKSVFTNVLIGALGLVLSATVALVWVYHNPTIASVLTEQTSQRDDLKYIRDRVDDIYAKLPHK